MRAKMPDDSPTGAQDDPGRKTHVETGRDADGVCPYSERRSSIQVAELVFRDGTLVAIRDEPFDFWLPDLN